MNEAKVICELRQGGKHIGNHLAGLPPWFEIPQRFGEVAVLSLKRNELIQPRHRSAMTFDQFRFVIPGFEMAAGAGAKNHQDILGPRCEVRGPGGVGMFRGPLWANRGTTTQELLLGKQGEQSDPAQTSTTEAKKVSSIQQPTTRIGEKRFHTSELIYELIGVEEGPAE